MLVYSRRFATTCGSQNGIEARSHDATVNTEHINLSARFKTGSINLGSASNTLNESD